MAEKKALLIIAENAVLSDATPATAQLLKKAALFSAYTAGPVLGAAIAAEDTTATDAAGVAEHLEKGTPFLVLDLGAADAAALDAALAVCLDAADRRTVIAVVSKGALALYGMGINVKAGSVARAAQAQDILPTLAFIADLPLTESCTGAVLYQALKNPNMKIEEVNKLKEALVRMETALARDNREPWDKHDCA